jgi:hypothetical protein
MGDMDEAFIPLRDVPNLTWLPPRRNGGRLALSTLWRWSTKGINGVILRTICFGSTRCTTEIWLREFFEDLAESKIRGSRRRAHTPKRRAREIAHSQDRLARAGFSRAVDEASTESRSECKESSGQLLVDENSS